MRVFGVVLLVSLGCAPSPAGPVETTRAGSRTVVVSNGTEAEFAFFVASSATAAVLDPMPEVSLDEPWALPLEPGDSREVEILGGETDPVGGLAVYLYLPLPDGRRARLADVQLRTGPEVRGAAGRVVIRRIPD